ncbi:glycoside hydrolase family 26 protein [Streptomyces sp. NPDC056707]|uniref:glycoside hydrolase family 26 protein n=1 Tax=Streptomyces sp. NPDC056707 TaxID=3345919 RepID=UPI00367CAA82
MTAASRRAALFAFLAATAAACVPSSTAPIGAGGQGGVPTDGASAAPLAPYDITELIHPKRKYLGATFDGAPKSLAPVDAWAAKVGKAPNMLVQYLGWGDDLQVDQTRAVWEHGILPFIAWEPFSRTLTEVIGGGEDEYIRRNALAVRNLNVPVAISFAHEMNGHWYPWGTRESNAAQFVDAWRHLHDVFQDEGVSNVIWVWSPNVINPVPSVRLKPYYPGDGYVDWLGIVGYYARTGPHTFDTLFGPTHKEVRSFTQKPVLLAETASEPTLHKSLDITDLFRGVAAHKDVIGFVWFDVDKESDWRIDSGVGTLDAFRRGAADARFGFDVKHP